MINKIINTANHYYQSSFLVENYYRRKRKKVLGADYLLSNKYRSHFEKLFVEGQGFLNDAEKETPNFLHRHKKVNRALGAWRWKALYEYREDIVPIIFDEDKHGLDFGGAASPVSLDIDILDKDQKDVFGREVKYHDFHEISSKFDFVFTSHTLEHISDLDDILGKIKAILKPGGKLIANVLAYSCTRWRAGIHQSKTYNDHKWTFKLAETNLSTPLEKVMDIDYTLSKQFDILKKSYTGDNSILLIAKV